MTIKAITHGEPHAALSAPPFIQETTMPREFCPDVEQTGANVTLRLPGPTVSGRDMEEAVVICGEHMRFDHASNFVFDLAEIEYLDSACIGSLVELLREVEPMRGRVALVGCRPNVQFLFKSTRLDSVFGLFDEMDEALASFSKRDSRW